MLILLFIYGRCFMGPSFGFGHGGHFMMMPWGLVILIICLALIWRMAKRKKQQRTEDSALVILRERYARGEINQEEFDTLKKNLAS